LFETLKDYVTKLETASYKTAMMLLLDILTMLENGIYPSHSEVQILNQEATKAWNICSDKDLDQKINLSKIRMFCKSYRLLFCEKTKTFKLLESLEPNEKNFLSKFVNSEKAKLEEISYKTQLFVDEIDQIKRLSYSTIKKEDFTFEDHGKLFKYWTLNKNMTVFSSLYKCQFLVCTFQKLKRIQLQIM
jgi:tRNA G10  N-methylase Trm11